MELQWQRHQEEEALLAAVPSVLAQGGVIEVAGQRHLDALLEAAAGQLVVLTVYSRCGAAQSGLGRQPHTLAAAAGDLADACCLPCCFSPALLPIRSLHSVVSNPTLTHIHTHMH